MQEETDSKLTNAPPPTSLSCTIKKRNQISDAELIRRCQSGSGHPPPWDDFFRRFLYLIDKRIAKSLLSFGLPLNKDSVDEIREELVIRLFSKNLLDKLENVAYFKAWIGQVIHNLVIDWVRKTNRSCDEFTRQAEKNTSSLSDSVSPGAETVLEDVLSTECIDNSKFEAEIDAALRSMEGLEDRYRIILQTSIMFYCPLSVENLQEIAELRGDSLEQVQQEERDPDEGFGSQIREGYARKNIGLQPVCQGPAAGISALSRSNGTLKPTRRRNNA